MSQLRVWLWGYFREHGRAPEPSSSFARLLEMARSEEIVPLVVDETAMQIVEYMRGKGKDLMPEQQAEWIAPYIREAARLIVSQEEAARGWRPIG